jgi:hypothetical protein
MPAFYTEAQKKAALKQLHINPSAKRVNSTQAANILTWRAREDGATIEYSATSVRKHAKKLDAQPALKEDGTINTRQNTYDINKLFEIDITPTRTNRGRRAAEPVEQ